MARAIVLMLDSLGIGASADADRFGDAGSDTFGHIVEFCVGGDIKFGSAAQGSFEIPNFCTLGLVHAAAASRGIWPAGMPQVNPQGAWGLRR